MYRGASYADVIRYQQCIDLWKRALEIRVEKDSILYTDTCFTAQALVRLMIDYNVTSTLNKEENTKQRFHDVVSTFRLITENIVGKFRKTLCAVLLYFSKFFTKKLL